VRHERLALDRPRGLDRVGGALHDLHAAALAASAGVDLRLHDRDRAAERRERPARALGVGDADAVEAGDPVRLQDLPRLILVDLHDSSDCLMRDLSRLRVSGLSERSAVPTRWILMVFAPLPRTTEPVSTTTTSPGSRSFIASSFCMPMT